LLLFIWSKRDHSVLLMQKAGLAPKPSSTIANSV
jgi:hypothetical protein